MKRTILMALLGLAVAVSPLVAKTKAVTGVVNLNTATAEELTMVPGIGKTKAEAILAYRQSHPFKATEELTEVKGIGPKMLQKIGSYLTVNGPTTIRFLSQETAKAKTSQ